MGFTDVLTQYKSLNNEAHRHTSTSGDPEIRMMNAEAPLLEAIQADTGETGQDLGKYVAFRGECPVCHSHDCMRYVREDNYWHCFSENNKTCKRGGGYSDYLMAAHGMSASEAVKKLREITNHPRMQASDSKQVDKTNATSTAHQNRFDHSELGDVLMQDFNACIADDIPVIWDPEHRRYRSGHEAIERVMIAQRRNITRAQRNETLSYIMLQSEKRDMADPRLIAFTNGILNLETLDLAEPSPEHVIPNVIPHRWNPDAACSELEEAIAAWACDDEGRVANIVETIGLCMYRGRDVTACPVLVGRGSNGKSTLLNLLRKVIGEENVSSLDLQTIGRRFQSVALIGKLANIADDIPNAFVEGEGMATLKRAITGDTIPAEIKGGATFSFRPYCRFVFSANEIPRFGDTSHGTYRRFVPVRFNARFSTADGTANTHLERALDTEQAYERAIVLGIDALKGCIERGHMTVTDDQREIIEDMRLQNSSVVTFVEESTRGREWFVGRTTSSAYEHYTAFCEKTGMKVLNRNNFTAEVKSAYDLTTKRTRWEGGQSSTFIERA